MMAKYDGAKFVAEMLVALLLMALASGCWVALP